MKKKLHRAQTMELLFGSTLGPFSFLQLLVMVVEVGVDLGMVVAGVDRVVAVGRRKGGRWWYHQQWWLMLM
jgi:hypothetical protein